MAGEFRAVGRNTDDAPVDLEFVPFYRLHRRTYAIYWDLYTHESWTRKLAQIADEKTKQRELEAATIAFYEPGDSQQDKAFNPQGEGITRDREFPRVGVRSKKWLSFDLPVESAAAASLVVTYHSEERAKRSFEVFVDGEKVGTGTIPRSPPGSASGNFYDINYKIPAEVAKDKKKLTVRFQSANGDETATIFGVRLLSDQLHNE
jgi:hypothetical protein